MDEQAQTFFPQRKRVQVSEKRVELALKLANFITNKEFTDYDQAIQCIAQNKRTWNWVTFSAVSKIPASYARKMYSMYFMNQLQSISDSDRMMLDQYVCYFIAVNQRIPTRLEVQKDQNKICTNYNLSTIKTYCYNLPRRNVIKNVLNKCK